MQEPTTPPEATDSDRSLPPPWNVFVPLGRQLAIWVTFFVILWFLRSFFFLVFLTFVFGYVQEHGVEVLNRRIASRRQCALIVFVSLLGILLGLGYTIGPALARQAVGFAGEIDQHLASLDAGITDLRERYELVRDMVPADARAGDMLRQLLAPETATSVAEDRLKALMAQLVGIASKSLWIGSSFLLALLFSFLVILDLPKLSAETRSLHDTRLRFIYDEVSDSIFQFGRVLGRALEVQLMIAIVNTMLTAAGLAVLGLPNVVFLSAIVFVCSFVPVAGVFVSSVPICMTALTASGWTLMLWAVLLIVIIHAIEAYVLNPRIYGAYLRINPVLVLAVLVIGHHMFGVWGMILGIPVLNYVIQTIRSKNQPAEAVAAG